MKIRRLFCYLFAISMIILGACSTAGEIPVAETTETPDETVEPEVLFEEDFSSGQVSGWNIGIVNPGGAAGWQVSETVDGFHYEGREHSFARPPIHGLTDFTAVFKFNVLDYSSDMLPFNFSFRENTQPGHHRYIISIGSNEIVLTKQDTASPDNISPSNFRMLRKLNLPIEPNIWHELKVSALENMILIYLNDKLIIEHLDQDKPYLSGNIAFETLAQSQVLIDDIVILRENAEHYAEQIAKLEEEFAGPIVNRTTHGIISWDETWRGEMHIVGDIIVEKGYTLTIEPGTTITIAAKQDLHNLCTFEPDLRQGIRGQNEVLPPGYEGIHPGEPFRDEANHTSIHIYGTLHAVGTPEQMITITSDSPDPDIWDWNFFTFQNGILSYCIMEYYRILHPGNGTVSHCILRNAGECGVSSWHSSALIEYNDISHAGHELVATMGGSPIIRYNNLGPNPGNKPGNHCGIVIEKVSSQTQIYGNNIYGCRGGIVYISGNPTIYDNKVQDCLNGFLYLNPPPVEFDITDNIITGNQYNIRKNY